MVKDKIPVGYITKLAVDVQKGDVVKDIGKIKNVKYVGKHEFLYHGESLILDALELTTVSKMTGNTLYDVLPFDEPVAILQYATLQEYNPSLLPLESEHHWHYGSEDSTTLYYDHNKWSKDL